MQVGATGAGAKMFDSVGHVWLIVLFCSFYAPVAMVTKAPSRGMGLVCKGKKLSKKQFQSK